MNALLCGIICASVLASFHQPNIVVILADDLGAHDLGCDGADIHETPRLDRLAAEGVRFTRAYAAAPVCTPTRAAYMTGRHPIRFGMSTWLESAMRPSGEHALTPPTAEHNLPLSAVTLAEKLHEAGYQTYHVGKWHLGDAGHYPEAQGFDVNLGGTFWGAPATHFHPFRGRWSQTQEIRYVPGLGTGKPGDYLADRLTDEAIALMEKAGDKPFFLSLCHYGVHTPIEASKPLVEKYAGKISTASQHQNATYAGMVENLDANVGRILDALDRLKIADDTLVIFTSDNGGYLETTGGVRVTSNAPLRSGKGSLYEGGVRVPLIVRGRDRFTGGKTVDSPVVTMDLHATVLHTAGLDITGDLDGVDLADTPSPERPLYFHFPHYYPTTTPAGAIRQGDWKLIEYFEDNRAELYNLADDPSEMNDLSASKPDVMERLRKELAEWRKRVGARLPTRRVGTE